MPSIGNGWIRRLTPSDPAIAQTHQVSENSSIRRLGVRQICRLTRVWMGEHAGAGFCNLWRSGIARSEGRLQVFILRQSDLCGTLAGAPVACEPRGRG
jgi:hypothetical protein